MPIAKQDRTRKKDQSPLFEAPSNGTSNDAGYVPTAESPNQEERQVKQSMAAYAVKPAANKPRLVTITEAASLTNNWTLSI